MKAVKEALLFELRASSLSPYKLDHQMLVQKHTRSTRISSILKYIMNLEGVELSTTYSVMVCKETKAKS
jgi:hypothetical protein